jgi:hypothetical protein
MPRLTLSSSAALSLGFLLLCEPALAFTAPLSDTAVREGYFLGQRRDETTARFLDSYTKHLPAPQAGPYISAVQVFTPYAQVVDFSRQQSVGYSAQQAQEDYRQREDTIEVTIAIELTTTYPAVIPDPTVKAGDPARYTLRTPSFWRAFKFQFSQGKTIIRPRSLSGAPTYAPATGDGGSTLNGATVWLEFNARDLASEDATVEVVTPEDQHIVATFDLAQLR